MIFSRRYFVNIVFFDVKIWGDMNEEIYRKLVRKTSPLSFKKEVAFMVSKIDKVDYERLRLISEQIENKEDFFVFVNDCLELYHNNQFTSYIVNDVFTPALLDKRLRGYFSAYEKEIETAFVSDVNKAYEKMIDKLKRDNDLLSRIYLYYKYVLNNDFFALLNTDIKFQKEATYLEKALLAFVKYHYFTMSEIERILHDQFFHFWFLKSIVEKNLSSDNPNLYLLIVDFLHLIPEGFESYPIINIIKLLPYVTHKEDLLYLFLLRLDKANEEEIELIKRAIIYIYSLDKKNNIRLNYYQKTTLDKYLGDNPIYKSLIKFNRGTCYEGLSFNYLSNRLAHYDYDKKAYKAYSLKYSKNEENNGELRYFEIVLEDSLFLEPLISYRLYSNKNEEISMLANYDNDIYKTFTSMIMDDFLEGKELYVAYNAFLSEVMNNEYRKRQSEFESELRELFASLNSDETQRNVSKVHAEVYLESSFFKETYYTLSLKIGYPNKKNYKVSSLEKFIQSFANAAEVIYGKELVLTHKLENFDETSQKIISYLKDKSLNKYDSLAFVSMDDLDVILDMFVGQYVYIDEKRYYISKEEIKPSYHIDDELRISKDNMDKDYYKKISSHYYLSEFDNLIYPYIKDEKLRKLDEIISRFDKQDISSYIPYLKKYYLDPFKSYFDISEKSEHKIYDLSFRIKAYIHFEGEYLKVKSEFFRGDEPIEEKDFNQVEESIFDRYINILMEYGFDNKLEMHEEDKISNFLFTDISLLQSVAEVYYSDDLANRKKESFKMGSIRVNSHSSSVVDVFLDESVYSLEELFEIYNSMKKKKKYLRLKDRFIYFNDKDTESFVNAVESFHLVGSKKMVAHKELPIYYGFKALGQELSNVQLDEKLEQILLDIKNFTSYEVDASSLSSELREYQLLGVKWLSVLYDNHLGGILADDMGLGKTLEIISLIQSKHINKPILIVCPKSLLFNWENEFAKFNTGIKTHIISGTPEYRRNIINSIKPDELGVYLISYDSLRNEVESFKDISFDLVVLDEAQFIKNVYAKKTNAVKEIKSEHFFALTGTPIENNILDLWSIFDFLMPGYLLPIKEFANQINNESYLKVLKKKTTPFILRRKKEDVLKDLPPKYEIIYSIEMNDKQKKLYEAFRMRVKKQMEDYGSKDTIKVLSILTRLRQICVDPHMFMDNYAGTSSKLDELEYLLPSKIAEGHRLLIFSQFVMALDSLEVLLNKLNISYLKIVGETKAKERIEICKKFNENEDIKIVLISLKAGGTGLNLTGADTVIHLDPWWNYSAESQASDRAHRIGQEKTVEIIKLICANSIEQNVLALQNEKRDLFNKMIKNGEESISSLSIDELKKIIDM